MEITLKIQTDGIEKEAYFEIIDKLSALLDKKEVSISRDDTDNINDILSDLTFGSLVLELEDDFIQTEEDFIEKEYLNKMISDEFFLDNLDRDYHLLSVKSMYDMDKSLFEKYPNKFDWSKISILPLDEEFVRNNINRLDIKIISTKEMSYDFIIDHIDILDLYKVRMASDFQKVVDTLLSSELIEKHRDLIIDLYNNSDFTQYFENHEAKLRDVKIDKVLNDDYDF